MAACGSSFLTASVFSVKNEAKSPAEREDGTVGERGWECVDSSITQHCRPLKVCGREFREGPVTQLVGCGQGGG